MSFKKYFFYYLVVTAPFLAVIFLTPIGGVVNSIFRILFVIITMVWGLAYAFPIFKSKDDSSDDIL